VSKETEYISKRDLLSLAYLGLIVGSCPRNFREGVCGLKVVLRSNFVLTKKSENNKK
jgi:hypothetical protein